VLGLAQVELAHRRRQAGGSSRAIEQYGELLADIRMLDARAGNDVANTLPDLVEAVDAGLAAALE